MGSFRGHPLLHYATLAFGIAIVATGFAFLSGSDSSIVAAVVFAGLGLIGMGIGLTRKG